MIIETKFNVDDIVFFLGDDNIIYKGKITKIVAINYNSSTTIKYNVNAVESKSFQAYMLDNFNEDEIFTSFEECRQDYLNLINKEFDERQIKRKIK